jgi:hypothetical protein
VHVVKPLVLSGFCRMVGWELAWRRIAFGRGGMGSQLAIEQSKGARKSLIALTWISSDSAGML